MGSIDSNIIINFIGGMITCFCEAARNIKTKWGVC